MWVIGIINKQTTKHTHTKKKKKKRNKKKNRVGRVAPSCHPPFSLFFFSCKKRWQMNFISAKESDRVNVSLKSVQGLKGTNHEHKSLTTTILRKAWD